MEEINNANSDYKGTFKEDFNTLDKRIMESKIDMYKAMFLSGLAQMIAILGGVLAIVKLMGVNKLVFSLLMIFVIVM